MASAGTKPRNCWGILISLGSALTNFPYNKFSVWLTFELHQVTNQSKNPFWGQHWADPWVSMVNNKRKCVFLYIIYFRIILVSFFSPVHRIFPVFTACENLLPRANDALSVEPALLVGNLILLLMLFFRCYYIRIRAFTASSTVLQTLHFIKWYVLITSESQLIVLLANGTIQQLRQYVEPLILNENSHAQQEV